MEQPSRFSFRAFFTLCGVVTSAAVLHADTVGVENIAVRQRWPWNGLVDITYDVVSDNPGVKVNIHANGRDGANNRSVRMATLTGDGVGERVGPGRGYRMTWDSAKDAPALNTEDFTVSLQAVSGHPLYVVVDLSEGYSPAYPSYPVYYLDKEPDGGWTDEYKTTKMVLRLIKPGVFMMGSPEVEVGRRDNEDLHEVTLTQYFYIGVFRVTQKQWELVMGTDPSENKGDMRPVARVYYEDIRGSSLGNQWPVSDAVDSTSFMGRLRTRTPFKFDLPTEAQWEYASRAGTVTALNNGKNLSGATCINMDEVGRYTFNWHDGKGGYIYYTNVGLYLPNAWGLYDMHGNVLEWCLDWHSEKLGETAVTDPKGPTVPLAYNFRITRGGGYTFDATDCRSAYRGNNNPGWVNRDVLGFRAAIQFPAPEAP